MYNVYTCIDIAVFLCYIKNVFGWTKQGQSLSYKHGAVEGVVFYIISTSTVNSYITHSIYS